MLCIQTDEAPEQKFPDKKTRFLSQLAMGSYLKDGCLLLLLRRCSARLGIFGFLKECAP